MLDMTSLLTFFLITILVALFPIQINRTPISLVNSICFAIFIVYGLFVEIIVTQFAILAVLIRLRISKQELYRLPINSLLFLVVSLCSAVAFHIAAPLSLNNLKIFNYAVFQVFVYMFVFFIVNQLLLFLIKRFVYQQKEPLLTQGFFFSFIVIGYTLPIGMVLAYLYNVFSIIGVYVMAVPLLAISIILKLYYKSKETNYYLSKVNHLAQQLTGQLSRDDVLDTFLNALPHIFPAHLVAVYDAYSETNFKLIRLFKAGQGVKYCSTPLGTNNKTLVQQVFKGDIVISYRKRKAWADRVPAELLEPGESIVAMPIKRNQQIVAILIMISGSRNAFSKPIISVLQVLNTFFGIALDNAKYYEDIQADSQTDYLTNLPNLRHFQHYLSNYHGSIFSSLIIIDLDHFKLVNDRFGHECGNEVLVKVAKLLRGSVGDRGMVARYGGEEFIVFLPNYQLDASQAFADQLRKQIEQADFICENHMLSQAEPVTINITASLGIANYPDQTEDINELIRLADRAMYIGAKRSGRNTVAVYNG